MLKDITFEYMIVMLRFSDQNTEICDIRDYRNSIKHNYIYLTIIV